MLKRFLSIDPLILLSLSILFCILRSVIPLANYFFLSLLSIFIIYTVVFYYRSNQSGLLFRYFTNYYQILILAFFVFLGLGVSDTFSFFSFKEALYVFVVLVFSFTLFLYVNSIEKLAAFTNILSRQLVSLSVIIGLMGILKFVFQLFGMSISFVDAVGTSLVNDYNFYVLFGFLGLISLFFNKHRYSRNTFMIVFAIMNINVLFSGSRRGVFLLILLWLLLFIVGFNFKTEFVLIRKRIFFLFIMLMLFLSVLTILRAYPLRINEKKSINFQSVFQIQIRQQTAKLLFRYNTILNKAKAFEDFYSELWSGNGIINTKRVLKRWNRERNNADLIYNGNFKHGLIFWQPTGKSTILSIIDTPFGKGVKVSRFAGDNIKWPLKYSGRKIVFYANHTYILNFKFKVLKGNNNPFKIGFDTGDSYYEKDLSITSADLEDGWKLGSCQYTFLRNHASSSLFLNSQGDSTEVAFTDITLVNSSRKEGLPEYADQISVDNYEVQKYLSQIDSVNLNPNQSPNLFSNGDFSLGTYNWIVESDSTALRIVDTPFGKGLEVARSNGDGGSWTLRYVGRPIVYYAGHEYKLRFLVRVIRGEGFPFNVGWWVNDGGQGYNPTVALTKQILDLNNGWKEIACTYRFRETHSDLPTFLNSVQDNTVVQIAGVELLDLDREDSLVSFVDQINLFSENADYLASKINPLSEVINSNDFKANKNKLYSVRTNRWIYSKVVFRDSLSFSQQIFGGGFDYLKMFGAAFGEVEYDYPHNPFLSAFLYSGIIGGLAYIWFMFLTFFYYIKYYRHHSYFFVCFLIAFFFSFFSVNTHFTIPAFAILSLIPFLTRYLVEKEKAVVT